MHANAAILTLLSQLLYLSAMEERTAESLEGSGEALLPDLPTDHLLRYLNTFPRQRERCESAFNCQLPTVDTSSTPNSKASSSASRCWGHEYDCSVAARFQTPLCPGDHSGWVQSKEAQLETFYYQADFGYIRQQIDELRLICEPSLRTDSSLVCSKYLRFCRGRNLMFDFRALAKRAELIRYHMDVLSPGELQGHCRINKTRLETEMDHMGALQSWSPELRNLEEADEPPLTSGQCDLIVNTPTFIMKIDATYNMYHHFCDFFNLYASLFVNQSHPRAFHTDVRILIWETYSYDSPFAETFKAFTHHPVWTLNEVKGKRVCFNNVVLPLLPRMIFGLYYNTPIIQGCHGSGLFRSFSEFILHRLQIPFHAPLQHAKVRITFLSRRTKYRQVLNEDELLEEINANPGYHVRRISFETGLGFLEQLAVTRNTDILIGMHGAGLTHLLFLPNWANIFELHNCDDPNCYKDLARLRGVHYLTWERQDLVYPQDEGHHPQGGAHAKFTNYSFDRKEFARLLEEAAERVRAHPEFQRHQADEGVAVEVAKDEL